MMKIDTAELDQLRAVMRLPRTLADSDRVAWLHEEATLRDQIVEFTYALDAADIDAVTAAYTDDCVLINPRGRYEGMDAIRANYVRYYELFPWLRHVFANIGIRFLDSFDEAYVTMFQFAIHVNTPLEGLTDAGDGAFAISAFSSDIWRVVKQNGTWKIAERTIHYEPRLYQKLNLFEMV